MAPFGAILVSGEGGWTNPLGSTDSPGANQDSRRLAPEARSAAANYDPENGTVIGWIMNQARSRAIDRLRFDGRRKRSGEVDDAAQNPAADPRDVLEQAGRSDALRAALTALTPAERAAIETSFFGGLTHVETAARLGEPLGTIKTRIRTGLQKLKNALAAQGSDS